MNPESLIKVRAQIAQEMAQHVDDMLVGDYEHTYFNLTGRRLSAEDPDPSSVLWMMPTSSIQNS